MGDFFYAVIVLMMLKDTSADRGDYIGCYRSNTSDIHSYAGKSVEECINICESLYFKYAILSSNKTCFCNNVPGEFEIPIVACNETCGNETMICAGDHNYRIFDTEIVVPGPPSSIELVNSSETSIRIKWGQPEAYTIITNYHVYAHSLESYADVTLPDLEWIVPNNTQHLELLNLQPGTRYMICVVAENDRESGPNVTIEGDTVIGTPEPTPPDIDIIKRYGDKMLVHIPEAKNINGPVSMYRIVVSIELFQQGFMVYDLGNYSYAKDQGLPYYITAELDPDYVKNDFTIGDGHTYNGFYNAPLALTNDIDVSLGVVSEKNHVKKIRYADSTKKIILNINEPESTSILVVILGAGISVCVVLLLIGVGLLIILRKRILYVKRQRGSQTLPLSCSEPVEIENAGFLIDEEEPVNHHARLKRKLWSIPRDLIDIDISVVIGLGSFGKFSKCKIQHQSQTTPALVQIISDKELERTDRKIMLQELDLLLRANDHSNVISLIGICETSTTLFVLLENTNQTLKELLLQSRHRDMTNNKFSLLTENKLIQMCLDVACGMEYLHNSRIVHKKLCCRNVAVCENGRVKVTGFGLSYIKPSHETPDNTRWSSCEMLKQTRVGFKTDVWSYGCLVWEAVTLGATPYYQSSNSEVAARILRGLRPSQPSYVGDELFQLCLQCWQVDPDERPSFSSLLQEMLPYSEGPGTKCLSFTHFNGFDYEPYIPHYEVIST